MVETQGSMPERIMPKGSLCLNRKSQIGPMPNLTTGLR